MRRIKNPLNLCLLGSFPVVFLLLAGCQDRFPGASICLVGLSSLALMASLAPGRPPTSGLLLIASVRHGRGSGRGPNMMRAFPVVLDRRTLGPAPADAFLRSGRLAGSRMPAAVLRKGARP